MLISVDRPIPTYWPVYEQAMFCPARMVNEWFKSRHGRRVAFDEVEEVVRRELC